MKERIQIITYSGTEKNFKDNNVVLSKISTPRSLDEFDINIIMLTDKEIWESKSKTINKVNCSNDLKNLGVMINYMHNTQILIVLPQNCTYYYYYDHIRGHGYFNNSELKDMLDELSSQILNDLCNILGVMRLNYENTLTKIGNKEYKAAFYFQVNDGILKSKKSNKSTVVRLHNIGYATTLEMLEKDDMLCLLRELHLIEQKDSAPDWIKEIPMFDDDVQRDLIANKKNEIAELNQVIKVAQGKLDNNMHFKYILYTSGDDLVEVVFEILQNMLGCDLSEFVDKKKEDFLFDIGGHIYIGEIKGVNHNVKNENVSQLDVHYQSFLEEHPEFTENDISAILIMNHQKNKPVTERENVHEQQINLAKRNGSLIIESYILLKMYDKYTKNELTREECINMFQEEGLLVL